MVEELKLAIKVDDDAVEQALLKQFANAEKMANKVVLTFNNIDLDDKAIEAKFKEMQKMAGKNPIDLSIDKSSIEMLSAISEQLGNIFNIAKGKSIIDSSAIDNDAIKTTISLFEKIESSITAIRKVFADVGDGEEFSPLLKMINNVQSSISELATSVKGIGLNMNIDVRSDDELDRRLQTKVANALQAYQKLFDNIKMTSAGGSLINQEFFDFNLDNYDTAYQKLQAIVNFIKKQRVEAKKQFNGYDALYEDSDKSLWKSAQAYLAQVTKAETEIKKANSGESNPLENLFGNTKDLSEVIEQLNKVVEKLNEISSSATEFKNIFKEGFNITASVEEIDKLTNRVKELEDELSKIKLNPVSVDKSNISSDNITNQIVENEKKKQEAYKATADAVMYHAGVISKLNKAETNGRFYGSDRGTGYFGTGHYFVDSATKHELDNNSSYSKLPYTSIDISQYDNLFKATTNEIADGLHTFLKNLTKFTQGSDSFSVSELFSQFQKVFGETVMDMQEFDAKLEQLKTYMQNSNMSDRGDSVSTQFMKSLGYGGVDTRGTKYADTRYGTVIYDLKEESILQANITDELQKQGQMLEKINYEKGQVFDKSEDTRIQGILDQQAKSKEIDAEFNKLYDSTQLKAYESELDSVNNKLKENDNIISECSSAIANADEGAKQFAKEMKALGLEMSQEEIANTANQNRESYQTRIDELEKERPLLEARKHELEQNLQTEYELANAARERAKAIVEERNSPIEDVFQGDVEKSGMDNITSATEEAVQAKKDFATANEGVQSSVDGSKSKLELEAELMESIAKNAREAANAKKEFVEANKKVKDSADKSFDALTKEDSSLLSGHSDNSEPSGIKRYQKKGYKAHDTGNHDNEKKVTGKEELGKALKELQSEIIASIDESTSFIKEVTDFYDSANNLVKTQMKVGDKNGSMRTYTTSYSMDKDGNATAWTSHIETQKIEQEAKAVQKLAEEKRKLRQQEKQSTQSSVDKALTDQVSAWKKIQSIREKIAKTDSADEINALQESKKYYQEQYNNANKILKANDDLYDKESQIARLEQIRLETNAKIAGYKKNTSLSSMESSLKSYQKQLSDLSIKPDDAHRFPEYQAQLDSLNKAIQEYRTFVDSLQGKGIIDESDITESDRLKANIEKLLKETKTFSSGDRGYTELGADKVLEKINSILEQNSAMSKKAKAQIKAYYNEILSGNPTRPLNEILDDVYKIVQLEREAGRAGKSWLDIFKDKKIYSFLGQAASMFSFYDLIRYGREGIDTIREFDDGLTKISYTMDMTKSQLNDLGKSVLDMANDLDSSINNAMQVSQIYANMNTSAEEIKKLSEPTLILSNLTGFDASTVADDIQAVTQQFDIAAESSMHIADVYDQISRNISVDYSKGIESIAEAVQVAGSTADQAGLSFEQLAAIVGKTVEKTRLEGSQVGNGLKTIMTRLSKVGELSEEVDNETLSQASESLKKVGIEVYNLDGSYREFDVIMGELAGKWGDLTDAEKSNISFNIAATRQTNLLSAVLSNFSDSMQLAEEATNANGNALENNQKWVDSFGGHLQSLENTAKSAWINILDSETIKGGVDVLNSLLKVVVELIDTFGILPTAAGIGGIVAGFKNIGRPKMFGLYKYADINMCSLGY